MTVEERQDIAFLAECLVILSYDHRGFTADDTCRLLDISERLKMSADELITDENDKSGQDD